MSSSPPPSPPRDPPPNPPPLPPPSPPPASQASTSTVATTGNANLDQAVASLFAPSASTAADDDLLFSGLPLTSEEDDLQQALEGGGGGAEDDRRMASPRQGPSSSIPGIIPPRGGGNNHEEPDVYHRTVQSYGSTYGAQPSDGGGGEESRWSEGSTGLSPAHGAGDNRYHPEATTTNGSSPNRPPRAVAAVSSPWQFDETVLMCSSCHSQFNWINRRHHCRLCGHIFCDRCTGHRALIPPSQIVLTPAGFQFNKRPMMIGSEEQHGITASFTPQEDPDRMLTYLAPAAASLSSSSSSSSSTAAADVALQPSSDPTVAQDRTIVYGRGLEERMHLAREPLRVCHSCYQRLSPLQPNLIASNSNMMRYNAFDPHDFRRLFNSPLAFTLGHEIRKAAHTLHNLLPLPKRLGLLTTQINTTQGGDEFTSGLFTNSSTEVPCRNLQQEACGGGTSGPLQPNLANLDGVRIPAQLLEMAKGIAVLTIIKGGLGFAGVEMGTGLVIARTHEYDAGTGTGWTPPSAIGTVGVSWGALIGAQVTDHVFLLMDDNAVNIMFGQTSLTLGVDVGIAVGPLGRAAEADLSVTTGRPAAGIYTYSLSKGLYAGISLDGKIIVTRNDVNEKFYGRRISGQELLRGHGVPTPPAAQPLYEALARCHVYASGHRQEHQHFRRNQQLLQPPQTYPTHSSPSSPYNFQGPPPSASSQWTSDPVMGEYGEVSDAYDSRNDDAADPYQPSSLTYYGGGSRTATNTTTAPSLSQPQPPTSPAFRAAPTIVSLPPPSQQPPPQQLAPAASPQGVAVPSSS